MFGLHWALLNFVLFTLSLAVLGLCCHTGFSLDAEARATPLEVCRLLLVVASPVAECRVEAQGPGSQGTWAQRLSSMWEPPTLGD